MNSFKMKTENQNCCFCFRIASGGNVVNSDIIDLLKFLIVNVNTSALENCSVCDSCLNKILETSEYKRKNSTKTLVDMKKEIDCEKFICQKCEKVCEQGDASPLMDCVTQINHSDFVNYLFPDQDSHSLESLQICGSCQVSVSNIQDFLTLIYVHDQSKMKCDIDNSDDIITTKNENLVRDKVEIKQEFENFIFDDKIEIKNIIEDNTAEMTCGDSKGDGDIAYADFKCKNEEVELKFEDDDDQSSDRYEKGVDKEITSVGGLKISSFSKEESQGMNTQGCSNRLRCDLKVQNNIRDYKCIYCSKGFVSKLNLDNHLLIIHKCKDGVTSKIHNCNECNFITTRKSYILTHKLKHGITVGLEKYKCDHCTYETFKKGNLTSHIKIHIRDFKCTFCSNSFAVRGSLDNHVLKVHKNKDSVVRKIHECDKCSYLTTYESDMLRHRIKHGITLGFEKYKCDHCTYETFKKDNFTAHVRTHLQDFKCTLCSKIFTVRGSLDNHLLKAHKNKDNVVSKVYECDKCSYLTTYKSHILRHRIKHGIKAGFEKYKCQHCTYETYVKSSLIRHIKAHTNTRDFKCTLCSKSFTEQRNLDNHLLKVHKNKNSIASKIHECDKCNFLTTRKSSLLIHKLKHE